MLRLFAFVNERAFAEVFVARFVLWRKHFHCPVETCGEDNVFFLASVELDLCRRKRVAKSVTELLIFSENADAVV